MHRKHNKKKNYIKIAILSFTGIIAIVLSVSFISECHKIKKQEKELLEYNQTLQEMNEANALLEKAGTDTNREEFMEQYAREKGYVRPDERVYVDITPGTENSKNLS